jgi:SET domain-containing protein
MRPDIGTYTRLKPSKIHGVGVFAIHLIPKGTNIFYNDTTKMVWINKSEIKDLDKELKKLYQDFCIGKGNELGCPENFNSLTIGWYLNESKDNPNVRFTKDFDCIAIRDIKEGEELLANYSEYSDR